MHLVKYQENMKKLATILSFIALSLFTYAQDKFTYTVKFDGIDQFEVKKAVGVLDPLFETHVILSADYQSFTYNSLKKITSTQILERLSPLGLEPEEILLEEN